MGLFSGLNVTQSTEVEAEQEERVGTGSKAIKVSGYQDFIVKMAYVAAGDDKEPNAQTGKAGGAMFIKMQLENEEGQKLTVTEYITSSKIVREGQVIPPRTYYEKDGKRYDLPGFVKMKGLNYLLTGVDGEPQNVEEREIKEYDWDLKAEVPVRRNVLLDWIGRPIGACVARIHKDKFSDKTKVQEVTEVKHWCDPTTGQFKAEKIQGGEAKNKQLFLDTLPESGIFDLREQSKGGAPAGVSTGSTSNAQARSF